jgi:RND superfamily putative drug exporter
LAVFAALLALAGCAFGVAGVGRLFISANDFNGQGSQSARVGRTIERLTGHAAAPTVLALVRTHPSAFSAQGLRDTTATAEAIAAQKGVAQTNSYPQLNPLTRLTSPLASKLFVSYDRRWSAVAATLSRGVSGTSATAGVVSGLQRKLAGHDALLGGSTVTGVQLASQLRRDIESIELWSLPLLLALLLFVLGRLLACSMPLLVGVAAAGETLAVVHAASLLGAHFSLFVLSTVTGLSLGLGIDYSLLIVARFREEIGAGRPPESAVRATVANAGRTVAFSALTIACSTAALSVFGIPFLSSVGLGASIAALLAGANALALLPAIAAAAPERLVGLAARPRPLRARGQWRALSQTVTRRPAQIAAITLLILLALALPGFGAHLRAEDVADLTPTGSSRQAEQILTTRFDPAASQEIVSVLAHTNSYTQVTALEQGLRQLRQVRSVGIARQVGRDLWFVNVLSAGGRLSATSQSLVKQIRGTAHPRTEVTGPSARYLDQQAALRRHLPLAALLVILTTFVILLAMTGSVVIPLKTLAMNTISFLAAFGVLVLIFQDGFLAGWLGVPPHGSVEGLQLVVIFSCVFALSSDYNVFVIARIQERHLAGAGDREAIAAGLERSGPVVSAAALLFCVAVGVFATSDIVLLKQVSIGMVLAVAIDATLVRGLLLPSVMALLGGLNWWAPSVLKRVSRLPASGINPASAAPEPTVPAEHY